MARGPAGFRPARPEWSRRESTAASAPSGKRAGQSAGAMRRAGGQGRVGEASGMGCQGGAFCREGQKLLTNRSSAPSQAWGKTSPGSLRKDWGQGPARLRPSERVVASLAEGCRRNEAAEAATVRPRARRGYTAGRVSGAGSRCPGWICRAWGRAWRLGGHAVPPSRFARPRAGPSWST